MFWSHNFERWLQSAFQHHTDTEHVYDCHRHVRHFNEFPKLCRPPAAMLSHITMTEHRWVVEDTTGDKSCMIRSSGIPLMLEVASVSASPHWRHPVHQEVALTTAPTRFSRSRVQATRIVAPDYTLPLWYQTVPSSVLLWFNQRHEWHEHTVSKTPLRVLPPPTQTNATSCVHTHILFRANDELTMKQDKLTSPHDLLSHETSDHLLSVTHEQMAPYTEACSQFMSTRFDGTFKVSLASFTPSQSVPRVGPVATWSCVLRMWWMT